MNPISQRRGYSATGDIAGARLFLGMVISLVVAVGMAFVLELVYRCNLYFYFVAPALAGTVVGGAVYLAVGWGRCRSRLAAMSLGALAGALMYLGYYYVDFVVESGLENAATVTELADFVIWRVEKAITKVGVGNERNEGLVFNWLLFLADFGSAVYIVSHFALKAARRAFCEHCGNWQRQVKLKLAPGVAAEVADALRQGRLDALPEWCRYVPGEGCPFDEITLEYCPLIVQQRAACPMHLSLNEHRASSLKTHLNKTSLMSQEEISADELAALAHGNPAFASAARDCNIKVLSDDQESMSQFSVLNMGA